MEILFAAMIVIVAIVAGARLLKLAVRVVNWAFNWIESRF